MKTLRIVAELTYDAEMMHGDDPESIEWFMNDVLRNPSEDGRLILHSNEIGDEVGELKVIEMAALGGRE